MTNSYYATTYNNVGGGGTIDDERRVNPLSGMGLTDEQYNLILSNIVNGESFMSGMDGSSSSGGGGRGEGSSTFGMSMSMSTGGGEKRGYEEAGLGGPGRPEKRSRYDGD
jgi:osomolarity two-component system response regulator SKN7